MIENNNEMEINFDDKKGNEYIILRIITEHKLFNIKRTKFISKDNYDSLIKIINKTKKKEFNVFLNYFNKIGIPILKILINGFIEFDNDKNQERIILGIIEKCINLYFNKDIFYYIYKKLAKYFRRHDKLKDIKSILKFEKLFIIWKLLYNLENLSPIYQQNDIPSITFFPNLNRNKYFFPKNFQILTK